MISIGRELIAKLLEKFPKAQITALSRTKQNSEDIRVVWQACDLFSLKSLEGAIPADVDFAVYIFYPPLASFSFWILILRFSRVGLVDSQFSIGWQTGGVLCVQ